MSLITVFKVSFGILYTNGGSPTGEYYFYLSHLPNLTEARKLGYKIALTLFEADPECDALYSEETKMVHFKTHREQEVICDILYGMERDLNAINRNKQRDLLKKSIKAADIKMLRVGATRRVEVAHGVYPDEYDLRIGNRQFTIDARGSRCLYITRDS